MHWQRRHVTKNRELTRDGRITWQETCNLKIARFNDPSWTMSVSLLIIRYHRLKWMVLLFFRSYIPFLLISSSPASSMSSCCSSSNPSSQLLCDRCGHYKSLLILSNNNIAFFWCGTRTTRLGLIVVHRCGSVLNITSHSVLTLKLRQTKYL